MGVMEEFCPLQKEPITALGISNKVHSIYVAVPLLSMSGQVCKLHKC